MPTPPPPLNAHRATTCPTCGTATVYRYWFFGPLVCPNPHCVHGPTVAGCGKKPITPVPSPMEQKEEALRAECHFQDEIGRGQLREMLHAIWVIDQSGYGVVRKEEMVRAWGSIRRLLDADKSRGLPYFGMRVPYPKMWVTLLSEVEKEFEAQRGWVAPWNRRPRS